jgi:hypothetical protein
MPFLLSASSYKDVDVMKSVFSAFAFLGTCCLASFLLGLFSVYLQGQGEPPIDSMQSLGMSLGAGLMMASMVAGTVGNRRIQRATDSQDVEAKEFRAMSGYAVVYVFRDAVVGRSLGVDITLDAAPIGQTRGGTFYRLAMAPGEHRLISRDIRASRSFEYRFAAVAGSQIFLEHRFRWGALTARHDIVAVNAEEARMRVKRCRLLLPERGVSARE